MVSAINSPGHKPPLTFLELRRAIAARGCATALLVLRIPEFERIAWRKGKVAARRAERTAARCFVQSSRCALRSGDCIAHDWGSDAFVIGLTAWSRDANEPRGPDYRAVLERMAAALSLRTRMRVETGWTIVESAGKAADLHAEMTRALERGARERERYEFFAMVGHELRTPLSSIRGYLETVLEEKLDPKTSRRFLETAHRESMRMGRLLEGMFEFSLLDLSGGDSGSATCDVTAQSERARDVIAQAAAQRAIEVQCNTSGAVVPLRPDACLQMLINLLDNAVKYGRAGGTVRITAHGDDSGTTIDVDDDGPGIDPAQRAAVFGLGTRGPHDGSRRGSGIGLAIVKLIAERAGGSVRASASPLGGARIEVVLPNREVRGGAS